MKTIRYKGELYRRVDESHDIEEAKEAIASVKLTAKEAVSEALYVMNRKQLSYSAYQKVSDVKNHLQRLYEMSKKLRIKK